MYTNNNIYELILKTYVIKYFDNKIRNAIKVTIGICYNEYLVLSLQSKTFTTIDSTQKYSKDRFRR